MQASEDLSLLMAAAQAAGEIALHHFGTTPRVWDKGPGQGPVSAADLEIDAMLRARLTSARPDYGWLSEETRDDSARLARRRIFIVDPIDGTRAFLDNQPGFAHALAVIEDGIPVAGVVHLPKLGQTYRAQRGAGAWLGNQRLSVSDHGQIAGAQILAARNQLEATDWPGGLTGIERHFRAALAIRLALVAEGRFDAMVTLRNCWHWDSAAAALLVTEAGGAITDRDGAPLRFNTPHAASDGVIAAPPGLHADLLARRKPAASPAGN